MSNTTSISKKFTFRLFKRSLDLAVCCLLLPMLIFTSIILLLLNLRYNKGPLYFFQKRMGRNCVPFHAVKFRTMKKINFIGRKYSDPLELDRITALGHLLRKIKIDELPQIINVIKGDMSLIGPRPDYYDHAINFIEHIPSYKQRHSVRPGISGLSQIRLGYAEGLKATIKKTKIDIYYIKNTTIILELKIFIGTIFVILKSFKK
jgi:lipopolysaccharide/colanic/teichoic acid biosynthesis glycosyltransferase